MAEKKRRARKKKVPPVPIVEETPEGVRVTLPGTVVRAPGPDLAVQQKSRPPVQCPYCRQEGREGASRRLTGREGMSYYECLECCDPERGHPTRFKVLTS